MSGNNLKVSGIIKENTAEKYPQTLKLFSANRYEKIPKKTIIPGFQVRSHAFANGRMLGQVPRPDGWRCAGRKRVLAGLPG
jgi:hypothetical protein